MQLIENNPSAAKSSSRFPAVLRQGTQGIIFQISEGIVAKVSKEALPPSQNNRKAEEKLAQEYEICLRLQSCGVSVPQPLKLSSVNLEGLRVYQGSNLISTLSGEFLGFHMEYLEGIRGDELQKKNIQEYYRAWNLYQREIRKSEIAGFSPRDVNDSNFMWVPRINRVVIYDFANWN